MNTIDYLKKQKCFLTITDIIDMLSSKNIRLTSQTSEVILMNIHLSDIIKTNEGYFIKNFRILHDELYTYNDREVLAYLIMNHYKVNIKLLNSDFLLQIDPVELNINNDILFYRGTEIEHIELISNDKLDS